MSNQQAFAPNQFDAMLESQGYIALSSDDLAFFRLELRALEVTEESVLLKVKFSFQMNGWDLVSWTGGTGTYYNVSGNVRFPIESIPSELIPIFERNIIKTEEAVEAKVPYDKQPKLWVHKAAEDCVMAFKFRPVLTEKGVHMGILTSIELPLGSLVWTGHGTGQEAEVEEMVVDSTKFISFSAPAVASQPAPNPGNAADALVRS